MSHTAGGAWSLFREAMDCVRYADMCCCDCDHAEFNLFTWLQTNFGPLWTTKIEGWYENWSHCVVLVYFTHLYQYVKIL